MSHRGLFDTIQASDHHLTSDVQGSPAGRVGACVCEWPPDCTVVRLCGLISELSIATVSIAKYHRGAGRDGNVPDLLVLDPPAGSRPAIDDCMVMASAAAIEWWTPKVLLVPGDQENLGWWAWAQTHAPQATHVQPDAYL